MDKKKVGIIAAASLLGVVGGTGAAVAFAQDVPLFRSIAESLPFSENIGDSEGAVVEQETGGDQDAEVLAPESAPSEVSAASAPSEVSAASAPSEVSAASAPSEASPASAPSEASPASAPSEASPASAASGSSASSSD